MTIPITFLPSGEVADAHPGETILEVAARAGVEIPANCGGQGACGACHVLVERGLHMLSPAEELEEDTLDNAEGVSITSRLACRARLGAAADATSANSDRTPAVAVRIPSRSKARLGIIES